MYTIGILGCRQDAHVQSLVKECAERNIKAVVLDFSHYPVLNRLTLHPELSYDDIRVPEPVQLRELDFLLIRNFAGSVRIASSTLHDFITTAAQERAILTQEYSVVKLLEPEIPVINPPAACRFHSEKAYQYFLLHKNGIPVPGTLVTANRDEIDRFLEKYNRQVIVKPNASGAEVVRADPLFFQRNARLLSGRPFIYQQLVSGRSFRAYLLGGKIVSAGEILFNRDYIDWREREETVRPCMLESGVQAIVEKAVRILGLAYCGVDLEYDEHTAQYYLLDFNPSALFTGWSRLVDINIAALIIEYACDVLKHGKRIWIDKDDC